MVNRCWLLVAVGAGLLLGCAPRGFTEQADDDDDDASSAAGNGGGSGAPTPGSSTGTGGLPELSEDAQGTAGTEDCGRQYFDVEQKPADVLLVLDRSASMQDAPEGGSLPKWSIVLPALQEVISATGAVVNWGLKVFPLGEYAGACSQAGYPTGVAVEIAPNNAEAVNQAITLTTPNGDGTPTGDAINEAVAYLGSVADNNPKYILLATDGEPSCYATGADDDQERARPVAITAVTNAAAAGYHTFVVGIATEKENATATLNSLAIAGLEPRPDPNPLATKYYLASTSGDLVAALNAITSVVATCLFPLGSVPPNPDHVGVFIGDERVTKDPANGWDFTGTDMLTIKLYGTACDQVTSSGAGTVEVVFGCKNDPII